MRTMPKAFDPTGWYVVETKKRTELICRRILDNLSGVDYTVETFVASQKELKFYANRSRRVKETIIIQGKIFVRVAERFRQDILRQCLYLTRFVKDPSLERTPLGYTAFARVPDREICQLRQILEMADGPVEYTEERPRKGDKIQVLTGRFSGLKGEITEVDGRRYAHVLLDSLGSFHFRLPIEELGKL